MMAAPTVSVLVTTYNHASFVCECLDSLTAQTSSDFEIIITDDASADGTADVIRQWLTRTGTAAIFVRNPVNRGICANRNAALALARGRFICSLSGDDAYEPDRIERQVACFATQPTSVAVVYSDMRMVDADGRDLGISYLDYHFGREARPEANVFSRLLQGCFIPSPAAMIRREALDQVGHYDESLFYEDYDMWLRLSARFRFCHLPGNLVRYRVLPTAMSRAPSLRPAMMASTLRILQSWRGKVGAAEGDLLWRIAVRQILQREDGEARRSLALAGRSGTRAGYLLRPMLAIPGTGALIRMTYRLVLLARQLRLRGNFLRTAYRHRSARRPILRKLSVWTGLSERERSNPTFPGR